MLTFMRKVNDVNWTPTIFKSTVSNVWDELVHPRDAHGRFTSKNGPGAGELKKYNTHYDSSAPGQQLFNSMVDNPHIATHAYHGKDQSKFQIDNKVLTVKSMPNGTHKVWVNTGHLKPSGGISKDPVPTKELKVKPQPGDVFHSKDFANGNKYKLTVNQDGSGEMLYPNNNTVHISQHQVLAYLNGGNADYWGFKKEDATPTGPIVKHRLEYHGGTSNKYYESKVEQQPNGKYLHTTTWGSTITGGGNSQVKTYDTYAQAKAAHDDIVQSKKNKGYETVSITGHHNPNAGAKFDNGLTEPTKFWNTKNSLYAVIQPDGSGQFYNPDGTPVDSLNTAGTWPKGHYTKELIDKHLADGKWSKTPPPAKPYSSINGVDLSEKNHFALAAGASDHLDEGTIAEAIDEANSNYHGNISESDGSKLADAAVAFAHQHEALTGQHLTPNEALHHILANPTDVPTAQEILADKAGYAGQPVQSKATKDLQPGDVVLMPLTGEQKTIESVKPSNLAGLYNVTFKEGPLNTASWTQGEMHPVVGKEVPASTPSGPSPVSGFTSPLTFKSTALGQTLVIQPDGSAEMTWPGGDKVNYPSGAWDAEAIANLGDAWEQQSELKNPQTGLSAPKTWFGPHSVGSSGVQSHSTVFPDGSGVITLTNSPDSQPVYLKPGSIDVSGVASFENNPDYSVTSTPDEHLQAAKDNAPSLQDALNAQAEKEGINPHTGLSKPTKWVNDLGSELTINPDGSGQIVHASDGNIDEYQSGYWDKSDVADLEGSNWTEVGTVEPAPEEPEPEKPSLPSVGNFATDQQPHLDVTDIPNNAWKSNNKGPGTGMPGLEPLGDELGVGFLPQDPHSIGSPSLDTTKAVEDLYAGHDVAKFYNTPTKTVYQLTDGRNLVFSKSGGEVHASLVDEKDLPPTNIGSGPLPMPMSQVRCNTAQTAEVRKKLYKGDLKIVETIPLSDTETVAKLSDGQYIKFERRSESGKQGMYARLVSFSQLGISDQTAETGQVVETNKEGVAAVLALPFLKHSSGSEGVSWANKAFAHIKLPSAGASSVKTYTGNSTYPQINSYLGKGGSASQAILNHIKNIDSAMAVSETPEPVVIHRGWYLPDLFNDEHGNPIAPEEAIGKTIKSKAYASCSVGNKAAFSGKPVQMAIHCPAGTHMVWAKTISHYSGENEMLLDRNVNLYIKDVKKVGSGYGAHFYVEAYVIPNDVDVEVIVPKGQANAPVVSSLVAEGEKPPLVTKPTKFMFGQKAVTVFPDGSGIHEDGKYYAPGTFTKTGGVITGTGGAGTFDPASGKASSMAGTTAPKPGSYTHVKGSKLIVYPDGHADFTDPQGQQKQYPVGHFQQQQITNSSSWTYQGSNVPAGSAAPASAPQVTQPAPAPAASVSTAAHTKPTVPYTHAVYGWNPADGTAQIYNYKSGGKIYVKPGDAVYQNGQAGKWMVFHADGKTTVYNWDGSVSSTTPSYSQKQNAKAKWNKITEHELQTQTAQAAAATTQTSAPHTGDKHLPNAAPLQPGDKWLHNDTAAISDVLFHSDGSAHYYHKGNGKWESKTASSIAQNGLWQDIKGGNKPGWTNMGVVGHPMPAANPQTGLSEVTTWTKPTGAKFIMFPNGSANVYAAGSTAPTVHPVGTFDASDVAYMNDPASGWTKQ